MKKSVLFYVALAICILYFSIGLFINSRCFISATLIYFAGCFEGVMDFLDFHYYKEDDFWNPRISWTNKYKKGDPKLGPRFFLSTSLLSFLTDGWHLMKYLKNLTFFSGLALNTLYFKEWYLIALVCISAWTINRLGFNLTFKNLKQ